MLLHRLLKMQASHTRTLMKENTKKFRRERLIPSSRMKTICLSPYLDREEKNGRAGRVCKTSLILFFVQIEGCFASNGFKDQCISLLLFLRQSSTYCVSLYLVCRELAEPLSSIEYDTVTLFRE